MEYHKENLEDGGVVYHLNGEIKNNTIKEFREELNRDVASESPAYFSFDFAEVDYIDSQGITCVVLAGKYNHNRGKKLEVLKAKDKIRRIFELAEIKFIEIKN